MEAEGSARPVAAAIWTASITLYYSAHADRFARSYASRGLSASSWSNFLPLNISATVRVVHGQPTGPAADGLMEDGIAGMVEIADGEVEVEGEATFLAGVELAQGRSPFERERTHHSDDG